MAAASLMRIEIVVYICVEVLVSIRWWLAAVVCGEVFFLLVLFVDSIGGRL